MAEARNFGVNWELALKVLNRCIAAGSPRSDQDEFIAICIPMAKQYAGRKASRYHGSRLAMEIDEDACLSSALEALRQIACKSSLDEGTTPDTLRNLCSYGISCRFTDLERNAMGRTGRKLHPESLDATIAEGPTRDIFRKDMLADRNDYSVGTRDAVDKLLRRLEKLLPHEEYHIIQAVITMKPMGYTTQEIAESMGKHTGTVGSTVTHVRTKLRKHYPEIEAEMTEVFADAIREGNGSTRPSRLR